jgi:hypothetical protein
MEGTRYIKRRVDDWVAKASKRAGVPIEIGDWHLGLGGAYFDDVVIGTDANVVISHISAGVDLNPLGRAFGSLESITVHRVRVKAPESRLRGTMDGWRSDALGDDAAQATLGAHAIERAFASLPVQRLTVRSGAVVVVDDDGESLVSVKGLKLFVDKRQTKVLFQAQAVKTRSGFADQWLFGRFELAPKSGEYRFQLRRRLAAAAGATASADGWSVNARLRKDLSTIDAEGEINRLPAFLAEAAGPYLGREPKLAVKGTARLVRDGTGWAFDARLSSNGTRVEMPLLSSVPLGPVVFDLSGHGHVDPASRTVQLDTATLDFPRRGAKRGTGPAARVAMTGQATLPSGDQGLTARGQVRVEDTSCQLLLDASPPGLLSAITDFKLDGTAGAELTFGYDASQPDGVQAELTAGRFACRVTAAPYAFTAEHLAGPFTLQREVSKDDEPLEIDVSPRSPGFTPLAQVSKAAAAAFVSSEDAGFWTHRGVDPAALVGALRKNVAEGRVAVGGSTITMQTVKNLYLSQDRTLSRKLQELFLAWHLENILQKERILEIYMNIVELGPGIYGITQASEHFFAKHPFDLNLMEASYLATLLPSPKRRYAYFCASQLTPTFRDMVVGLMRRTVNLGRIGYDRYEQGLAEGLHFNDEARAASHECTRRSGSNLEVDGGL